MERIISLLIGYGFGLFQTAYLYGRMNGFDIRRQGSGNPGTTNMLRTRGLKAGLLTLAGDMGKCILAVLFTWLIFRTRRPELVPLVKIWTSVGVILGHNFPFYMGFRGGKGIAATGGMIIAFGDLRLILVGILVFFGLFFLTHYVSLASLALSTAFLVGVILRGQAGTYGLLPMQLAELYLVVLALAGLAFFGHRENLGRLLAGTERKTYLRKRA